MDGDHRAERARGTLELAEQQKVGVEIEAGATPPSRHGRPEEPEGLHLLEELEGNLLLALVLEMTGPNPFVRERADGVDEIALLGCQSGHDDHDCYATDWSVSLSRRGEIRA